MLRRSRRSATAHRSPARAQSRSDRATGRNDCARRKPRAVVTAARGSSDNAATFARYLIETRAQTLTSSQAPVDRVGLHRAAASRRFALPCDFAIGPQPRSAGRRRRRQSRRRVHRRAGQRRRFAARRAGATSHSASRRPGEKRRRHEDLSRAQRGDRSISSRPGRQDAELQAALARLAGAAAKRPGRSIGASAVAAFRARAGSLRDRPRPGFRRWRRKRR